MRRVFLDTSYAIALSVASDVNHGSAVRLARKVLDERWRLVATPAVAFEIGNMLSKPRYRPAAVALLDQMERDPAVEVVPLTPERYAAALDLFRQRSDKEWGLADCLAFVLMWELGITEALTADHHFEQAGFRALLRADS